MSAAVSHRFVSETCSKSILCQKLSNLIFPRTSDCDCAQKIVFFFKSSHVTKICHFNSHLYKLQY